MGKDLEQPRGRGLDRDEAIEKAEELLDEARDSKSRAIVGIKQTNSGDYEVDSKRIGKKQ